MNMKKTFLIISAGFLIFNAAVFSFNAARGNDIAFGGIRQVNSVKSVNMINVSAKPQEGSFVAAALTSTATVGGKGYSYILWTQQQLTQQQVRSLIDYVSANTHGRLSKITYENTFIAFSDPYVWRAGGQGGKTLVFSRYVLRQNDRSILSSFAYGVYDISEPSTTQSTTQPTTQSTTQTTSTTQTQPGLTQITRPTVPEQGVTRPSATTASQTTQDPVEIPQLG